MVWVAFSLAISALAAPQPFPVQYEQTVAGREVTKFVSTDQRSNTLLPESLASGTRATSGNRIALMFGARWVPG